MCRVLQRNRWALFILVRTTREDLLEGGLLHLRFEGSVGLLQIVKKKKKAWQDITDGGNKSSGLLLGCTFKKEVPWGQLKALLKYSQQGFPEQELGAV